MTTFRVAKRRRFTVVDREFVNNSALSFKAKGLLLWLLDKPDDWRVTSDEIARTAGPDGRDAVRAGLRELEQAGYLRRERIRVEGGRFITVTSVYEVPGRTEDGFSGAGETDVGFSGAGEPGPLPKTDLPSTETDKTPLPPKGGELVESEDRDAQFEEFWAMYGRTGPKQAARRAWDRARKSVEHEDLLNALERWVIYWNSPGAASIKWPQGWLNQGYYLNDPPMHLLKIQNRPVNKGVEALRRRQEARGAR